MKGEIFGGNSKVGKSLVHNIEQRFINWATPKVPQNIHSYHLTMATLPICVLIIVSSYLAQYWVGWLWLSSIMIALQWLTDSLDGAVGRFRKEGLIRWGFYMDHFLDYVFLVSIILSYTILLQGEYVKTQLIVLIMFSLFMVNSFLGYGATNEFKISYLKIGPTEIRLVFILVNTLLIIFGKTFLVALLPYILIFSFLGLCVVVFKSSREIWEMDQMAKNNLE